MPHRFPSALVLCALLCASSAALGRAQGARILGPGETYSAPLTHEVPLPGPQGPVNFGPPNPLGEPARVPVGTRRRYPQLDAPDLSQWDFWWGTNGPELLESMRAPGTDRPTPETLTMVVVPALIEASRASSSPRAKSAALFALAKVGDQLDAAARTEHLLHCTEQLASRSQRVAETAALALGVLGDERAVPLLAALMQDGPRGRQALRRNEVPKRTRTFAAYALGLIAERDVSNDVRRAIAAHLIAILEEPNQAPRQPASDLKVGAMDALGLVRLDWPSSTSELHAGAYAQHVADRCSLIAYLVDYMDPERERARAESRHWFVRAHAPLAVARLFHCDATRSEDLPPEAAAAYGSAVYLLLRMCSEDSKERKEIQESAIIALGLLAAAPDTFSPATLRAELDAPVWVRLSEIATQSWDNQQEYFALIALAEAGGRRSGSVSAAIEQGQVQALLLSLSSKAKGQKQPWTSLALAVHGRAVLSRGGTLDGALASALRTKFNQDKTPQTTGAHALALAMLQDGVSGGDLLRRFERDFLGSEETVADIAQALGSLGMRDALEPIKARLHRIRPRAMARTGKEWNTGDSWKFMACATSAVGRLGARDDVPYLVDLLRAGADHAWCGGVAVGLGLLGDTSAVAPLVALLHDSDAPEGARAAAATALGLLCDTAGRPWNASYLRHANYRVNTLCLDDEAGHGIFELL